MSIIDDEEVRMLIGALTERIGALDVSIPGRQAVLQVWGTLGMVLAFVQVNPQEALSE